MNGLTTKDYCEARFTELFARPAAVTASAPGRLEVLGNHTDYNNGLTLSCAVALRCDASIAALDEPVIRLASTAFDGPAESFPLDRLNAPKGHWANYVLGLVAALNNKGVEVPGFALLIDSKVPRSAGLSSSSAVLACVLTALAEVLKLDLSAITRARLCQYAESEVVGARTGLLDPLTSLLGKADQILGIDFLNLETRSFALPAGWCFVAVDSGVKHDLTATYNQRRLACERAAALLEVSSLRDAGQAMLDANQAAMSKNEYRCALHVMNDTHPT